MTVNKELQLELHPCYDCSNIEGESELSTSRNIEPYTGVIQWYLGYFKFISYYNQTYCTFPPVHNHLLLYSIDYVPLVRVRLSHYRCLNNGFLEFWEDFMMGWCPVKFTCWHARSVNGLAIFAKFLMNFL